MGPPEADVSTVLSANVIPVDVILVIDQDPGGPGGPAGPGGPVGPVASANEVITLVSGKVTPVDVIFVVIAYFPHLQFLLVIF